MVARKFSNIAVATTLSSGIGSGDVSLTVVSATGWPAAPFILVIELDDANEELILVGAKSGAVFSSLTRGFGGTTGVAHNAATAIKHVSVAEDHSLVFTHVHVPGTDDTVQIDHGGLAGLSDDDHAEYLKDKANGGLAAEVPTHTHADAANAGQFDHGNAAGLADDDHTQYFNSARHNDAEHAAINHDALAGLGDDDHTQYPLKSIATTKGDLWVATGAGTLVRVGVGAAGEVLVPDSGEAAGVMWDINELENSVEEDTEQSLSGATLWAATVSLVIPATWGSWGCFAMATYGLVSAKVGDSIAAYVVAVEIDGTAQLSQIGGFANLSTFGWANGSVAGRRTGMVTTGSRDIRLGISDVSSSTMEIRNIFLYARAVRTS